MLPLVVFSLAALGSVWLWQRQRALTPYVGQIVSTSDLIQSAYDGRLVAVDATVVVNAPVSAGQILARFDGAELTAELEILTAEVKQRRAELEVRQQEGSIERLETEQSRKEELRGFRNDRDGSELERIEAKAGLEVERLELRLREERYVRLQALHERGLATDAELEDVILRRDRSQAAIRGAIATIEQLDLQCDAVAARLAQYEASAAEPESTADQVAATFAAQVSILRARMAALAVRRERLEVRAPRAGIITEVLASPGQWVRAGDALVRIQVSATRDVVGYLVGARSDLWRLGVAVEVRRRSNPKQLLSGRIAEVGPAYGEVPLPQRPAPNIGAWGLPVRIALPAEHPLQPGELVDFRLLR